MGRTYDNTHSQNFDLNKVEKIASPETQPPFGTTESLCCSFMVLVAYKMTGFGEAYRLGSV